MVVLNFLFKTWVYKVNIFWSFIKSTWKALLKFENCLINRSPWQTSRKRDLEIIKPRDGTLALPYARWSLVQFSSVAQSCLTLCDSMNHSTPGLPVHHQLPEFTQTHVHRVRDAIQPSHPLTSPSPSAPNPSQHQSLFQWVNSSHEVAKVLEFQL